MIQSCQFLSQEKQKGVSEKRKQERAKVFIPPEEKPSEAKKQKVETTAVDVESLKKKIKKAQVCVHKVCMRVSAPKM